MPSHIARRRASGEDDKVDSGQRDQYKQSPACPHSGWLAVLLLGVLGVLVTACVVTGVVVRLETGRFDGRVAPVYLRTIGHFLNEAQQNI